MVLTLAISYEVFVRYVLRSPTKWAFDISYITYGAMFLMAGAKNRVMAPSAARRGSASRLGSPATTRRPTASTFIRCAT